MTRRKRYGRRLHRTQLALDKSRRHRATLENEIARLRAKPGILARLRQWWFGTSAQESELRFPSSD